MRKGMLLVMLFSVLVAAAASISASGAELGAPVRATGEPCYVVIAVDVSGSMERADAPQGDARRRRWTLRDEGQLVLMQLLPFVYSDLHVGVCHFSDRVRYALPSEETGPLLAWGGSYLSEAACRNMVRPAEFVGSYQTDIAESMDWALARIRAARRRHGDGPGKVLLLSHGDPRDSSRELAGEGPLLAAGARLAEQDIRVYPIIVNEASPRPGSESRRLSLSARTAESVMLSLASISGGRAYRLTPEMGFPDILMDVFGLGRPLSGGLGISPYDWAVVMVGRRPESVSVVSAGPGAGSEAVTWGADNEVDPRSGIRSRDVPSRQWPVTILRRPDGEGAVGQFWEGTWTPLAADGQREMGVRIYRVPDFVVKLEAAPAFPWWVHQEGQVTARLLDRHAGRRTAQQVDGSGRADGLAVRLTARGKDQGPVLRIDDGRWTTPGRTFATESFTFGSSGLYDVTCDLLYALGDVNVPLTGLTEEVQVYQPCVGVDILSADDDAGLGELPEASGVVSLDAEGGKDVYFRVTARGSFNARPRAGVLHLAPLDQEEWILRKDASDDLSTGSVRLPEDEDHLTAWARLEVDTPAGLRQFRLPDYELAYRPAPLRVECTFGEPRRALWVGEFHRQLLTISAFPVFEAARDRTEAMFPETLSAPRLRTVDLQSGTAQVTGPRGRLIEVPKATGAKGRTVAATYALEAGVPIAPADQCEISVDGAIPALVGGVKTYAVVDPAATGLFRWTVRQEPVPARSERVSEVLYRGEPVRFSAQWQADQNVSAVRFEIPRPEREEPFSVALPITAGAGQASVEPILPQLERGETYAVHVYVTMKPSSAAPAVEVKLRGGQFRAEDRRLLLGELVVGTERATDIPCRAWEPIELPLRAVFSGYLPGNPQHSAIIEQFKELCTVTVTSSTGATRDVTSSVEWTALVVAETEAGRATTCELRGHASYTPQNTGRATVDVKAQFPVEQPGQAGAARRAYGHLSVKEPRLTVGVQRLTPGGAEPVFDSQAWVEGTGGLFPVTEGFSTRLRVTLRAVGWAEIPQSEPLTVAVRVLRRSRSDSQWTIASGQEQELTDQGVQTLEVQVSTDGQYALEIVGQDRGSGRVVTRLLTPVVTSIQRYESVTVLSPPAWITPRVRQWPFKYRVTLRGEQGDLTQAALSFQFQLPGEDPVWLEGITRTGEAGTSAAQSLSVRGPQFLPAPRGLGDGVVRFKLSAHGLELLSWEYPNVRVLDPVLERLALSRGDSGREIEVVDGGIDWNGSAGLVARPVFRSAPELIGQWVRAKTRVYLWPYGADALPRDQGPLLVQQGLKGRGERDCQVFTIEGDDPGQAVEILPRRVRRRFWGWPQSSVTQRYALAASALYEAQEIDDSAASEPADSSTDQRPMVAEWTDIYSIDLVLPRVIPWGWWVLAVALLYVGIVAALRPFAQRPDGLGLDVRLSENVAVIEPVSLGSPVRVELYPTALRVDMELHARYLGNRWGEAARKLGAPAGPAVGNLLRCVAMVVARVGVVIRRGVLPRRWAWALITPRLGSDSLRARSGLLCVWTSPFARARAWSSETGLFDLPEAGQATSVTLDLPYQMDQATRTMRVSVNFKKTAPKAPSRASETVDEGDSGQE